MIVTAYRVKISGKYVLINESDYDALVRYGCIPIGDGLKVEVDFLDCLVPTVISIEEPAVPMPAPKRIERNEQPKTYAERKKWWIR